MIKDILIVGAGSFMGGAARYLVSLLMRVMGGVFPWGTFTVNIVGCLLIGMLWGWTTRWTQAPAWISLLLITGFCGGFTTFSTFSKESLTLFQSGNYTAFLLYAICSVIIGILAVLLGVVITK